MKKVTDKFTIFILEENGDFGAQDYPTLEVAADRFAKLVSLLRNDPYRRVVKLVVRRYNRNESLTFDSVLD